MDAVAAVDMVGVDMVVGGIEIETVEEDMGMAADMAADTAVEEEATVETVVTAGVEEEAAITAEVENPNEEIMGRTDVKIGLGREMTVVEEEDLAAVDSVTGEDEEEGEGEEEVRFLFDVELHSTDLFVIEVKACTTIRINPVVLCPIEVFSIFFAIYHSFNIMIQCYRTPSSR